ncbi:hypothetical protein VB715_13495 [Crocosphaera sp. UHCC 0190]|uniref:hypothetical protein n=1 Tax=Crocosphaera sp. UHCC 0190 TaxID=3110246 RepID=UPI002B1F4BB4|nr:hypothetical protein [Crocosphaera sp. UHCC 0190]MEA5510782.1 hypothetical protein [Crocosphaera sp. UHCC 0190]
MQLSSDSFYKAVQYLDNHPESIRIKKLIFCICKQSWENDINILNSFPLETLIKELIQEQKTVEQLTLSLYKLVKTLNRPKVYAGVAKAIIEQLGPIYRNMAKPTEVMTLEPELQGAEQTHVSDATFLLEQALRNLNSHPETARIHKLIYAIGKNSWENDLNRIQQYGLKNLIVEILEIYPSKKDLEFAFLQLVENINKKNLYLAISKIILNQIGGLYDNLPGENDPMLPEQSSSYSTQIIAINTTQNYANLQTSSASAFETSVIDITSEQMVTELKQVQAVPPSPSKTYDIFELRLEIMQYTNPLRAKILLFSLLFHPWDRSGQDWSMLRSYTLDDLLEQILQSGRPMTDIEAKLYHAAKSLNDPDSHLQTASTIVEAIKPFI